MEREPEGLRTGTRGFEIWRDLHLAELLSESEVGPWTIPHGPLLGPEQRWRTIHQDVQRRRIRLVCDVGTPVIAVATELVGENR